MVRKKINYDLTEEQVKEYINNAKAMGAKTISAKEACNLTLDGLFIVTAESDKEIEGYKPTDPIAILSCCNGQSHSIIGPASINLLPGNELEKKFFKVFCYFPTYQKEKIQYALDDLFMSKKDWEIEAKKRIKGTLDAGFTPPPYLPENLLPKNYKKKIIESTKNVSPKSFKATVKSDLNAVATRVAVKKSTELFTGLVIDFLASNKNGSEATIMKKKVKDFLSTEDGKAAFQILIGALLPLMTNSDKIPESIKDVIDTVGKEFRTDGMTHFATEFVDYISGPGAETFRKTVIKAFESFKKIDEMTNENGEINIRAVAEPTLSLLTFPKSKEIEEKDLEYVEHDVAATKVKLKSYSKKN
jgi:hypothetical protein